MTERASPMMHDAPSWLRVDPQVAAALAAGQPVVALESAVITHGLPRPVNLETARYMETEILAAGVQPAIVALLDGEICLGLSQKALERLALADQAIKISRRDLGIASVRDEVGGTTVAATMIVAHAAGVKVFATGGIGGVHFGSSGDVSADLPELARTPVAVVCSGAKAILDLPRTMEWLETAGVPIIGWRTDELPAFFCHGSGLSVNVRVDTAAEAANILRSHWGMNLESSVLICVPCPEDVSMPFETVQQALAQAEAEAKSSGITGKNLTPFLLNRLSELSNGATLRANLALLRNNARVAAAIAKAMS
jgi:pseudouridine-5'-phosphate glycosidase